MRREYVPVLDGGGFAPAFTCGLIKLLAAIKAKKVKPMKALHPEHGEVTAYFHRGASWFKWNKVTSGQQAFVVSYRLLKDTEKNRDLLQRASFLRVASERVSGEANELIKECTRFTGHA